MPRRTVAALGAALALALAGRRAPAAAADPAAALPGPQALAPLVLSGGIERHTPESLWERIDGEAELYRSYGLTGSAHARYEDPAVPDRRVELSAFAVEDALGAFGLFAAFRSPACPVQPLGGGGCLGDYQGFFWHGRLFVLADAAGPDASRPADLGRALAAAAALLGPPPPAPAALQTFGRVAKESSVRYQPLHLLGRAALPPGLEGTAGDTGVFVSTARVAQPLLVLEAYAGSLQEARRGDHAGRRYLSGRDPLLGPVTLLAGEASVAGARAAAGAGILELLAVLVESRESAAADASR